MSFDSVIKNRRGSSLKLTTAGYEATEVWHVTFTPTTESEFLFELMTDPDMPVKGDEHPIINPTTNPGFAAIYLVDIDIQTHGANKAQVTLQYRRPDRVAEQPVDDTGDGVIEVGATVTQEETELDNTGTQITVEHDFSSTQPERGTETQGGQVAIQVPRTVVRVERHETVSPLAKALAYVGTVNDTTIWSKAARTWLCAGITGRSDNGGESYQVTYEFIYNPDTWDQTAVFIDPQTGRPPDGIVINTGTATVEVQPDADFSALNLSI